MPAKLTFRNVQETVQRMRITADQWDRALERAALRFGHQELTEMERRTPVKYGPLRDSGEVTVEWKGRVLTVTWSFGGASASYAIYVHEDMEAFHQNGQAKFCESVTNESAPHMLPRILAFVQSDLGL